MKTTIDLPDELLQRAKALARHQGTTLRALVETGLRQVLRQRQAPPSFQLRDASFQGEGLQPEFAEGHWDDLRRAAYEKRGG